MQPQGKCLAAETDVLFNGEIVKAAIWQFTEKKSSRAIYAMIDGHPYALFQEYAKEGKYIIRVENGEPIGQGLRPDDVDDSKIKNIVNQPFDNDDLFSYCRHFCISCV